MSGPLLGKAATGVPELSSDSAACTARGLHDCQGPSWARLPLEFQGGCFVDPERDCTSFRRLDVLKGVAVNSKCKLCFKEEQGGDLNQRGDKGPNADSSGSSSEESSSSEDGQEAEAANDAASCYAVEDW